MSHWHKLLAALAMMVSPVILAQESAEQWLQKMLTASKQASFSGRSVLLSGGELVTLSVFHAPIDDEVWERVVHMSGEPAEIIRRGANVACLHRDQVTGMAFKSPINKWSELDKSVQGISKYYRFERVGVERVAGREAVRLNVLPLDGHRYGYSLWLDGDSGVLLKSQTGPRSGGILEVFEFVDVTMGQTLSESDFEPGRDLKKMELVSKQEPVPTELFRGWQVDWIPDGFVESQRKAQYRGRPRVSTRAYTDGLAAVTVFVEPSKPVSETASARGATVAVSRNIPGAMVTVVGEIPLATAEKIAANVKILAGSR
jgi:sigma-E factor negative regulatory protein RseB